MFKLGWRTLSSGSPLLVPDAHNIDPLRAVFKVTVKCYKRLFSVRLATGSQNFYQRNALLVVKKIKGHPCPATIKPLIVHRIRLAQR